MCIYYTDRNDLTYTGQEHIIPAGLGGLTKLKSTFVCDQFNNKISALEQDFLRNSLVGINRELMGPGKRGNLSEKKATKSKVHLITFPDGSFSLGYLIKGRQVIIPYISINTNTGEVGIGFNNAENFNAEMALEQFKKSCTEAANLRIRSFINDKLPKNIVLRGIQVGIEENFGAFFVKNEESDFEIDHAKIAKIGVGIASGTGETLLTVDHAVSTQTTTWKMDYFRVYAKMAFNFLAHTMGDEFAKNLCFDRLRNWIINGGKNEFGSLTHEKSEGLLSQGINFPEFSHTILLIQQEQSIFALISLYNSSAIRIELTNQYRSPFPLKGIVCDWKNREEYSLAHFLTTESIKIFNMAKE